MTGDPPSPFELAAAELRALGITLASLPGEYRVNYRNGQDATARHAETLDEALSGLSRPGCVFRHRRLRSGWGCNLTLKERRSLARRPWDL